MLLRLPCTGCRPDLLLLVPAARADLNLNLFLARINRRAHFTPPAAWNTCEEINQLSVIEVFQDKSPLSVRDDAAWIGLVPACTFGRNNNSRNRLPPIIFDDSANRTIVGIQYQVGR